MSRTSIPARHRAVVTHSIALEGLSHSAKTGAAALGKPAIIAAATGGLVFAVGAPAQAGTYTQDAAGAGAVAQAPVIAAPAAPIAAPVAPAATAGVHTVAAGDTMGAIAAQHGISLEVLLAQNGLSYASVIYPGQQITLSGGAGVAVSPAAVPAAAPASQVSYTAPAPVAAPAPQVAQPGYSLTSATIAPIAPAAPAAARTSAPASGVGAALVASAYSQIGSIQDCTVLVERALRSIGLNVGDLGPLQFAQYGTRVSTPAAGDLVINGGHVAIYVGNGRVISSGMNGANLTMEHPLSDLAGSFFVRVNG